MREIRVLYTSVLALLVALAIGFDAPRTHAAHAADTAAAALPASQSLSGGYLAGRYAQRQQDWDAAQTYMGRALDHDQNNGLLEQRTFLLALGAGNFEKARPLANSISNRKEGFELALIFLACDALSRDQFADALGYLKRLPAGGFGQYTKPILTAWSLAGEGKKADALKLLSAAAAPGDPAYHLHAGMIEEYSGDMNAAADHYKAAMAGEIDFHTAVMIADFFERYGQPEIAASLYRGLEKAYPFNPFVNALAHRDPARKMDPVLTRPAEGASLALFDLATLLYGRRAYDSAQIYGNLVRLLDHKSSFAKMMMGDIAALTGQYQKAIDDYDLVDKNDPVYQLSRIRVAEIYESAGQTDKSVEMLKEIAKNDATRVQALVSLGDTYRRHEKFDKAIDAYDQALEGVEPITNNLWPILYARGIAKAQMNRWDLAEKDLLQALSFQPRNPMILNFLAYSWADQGVNLDRALEFAKSAAALKPDDGYILDSYGWTLFRMARYGEAITYLEMAVEQVPGDATLLDHLGDAYWQVGRQNEARYQWRRAGDMSRDNNFKKTVEQKLKNGIVTPEQAEHKQAKL